MIHEIPEKLFSEINKPFETLDEVGLNSGLYYFKGNYIIFREIIIILLL